MKIDSIKLSAVNEKFDKFAKRVVQTPNLTCDEFLDVANSTKTEFLNNGMEQNYCQRVFELTTQLIESGKLDFAGIICSSLVKLNGLPFEQREAYIKKAIEIAELQGDLMHQAARLHSLHKLYESIGGQAQKDLKVLIKEERVLTEIIENFDISCNGFKTVKYRNENINGYKKLLAWARVNIAKILKFKKPNKAEKKLREAMDIFKEIGDEKNYAFAEKVLLEILYLPKKR